MLTDGTVNYIYDDNGNPVEQIDSTGVVLYYQHDQYGSTRLLTNQAGAIAASYTYNAYGALTTHTGTADTPLRWNGQYQDTDTCLYYLRARYYNPATAQFLTRDPLVALTLAAYAYAGGDPLNSADPLGLNPFEPWTYTPKTWANIGIGLGMVALAATGVGLGADAGLLGGLAGSTVIAGGVTVSTATTATAIVAGTGAAALDYKPCVNGDKMACGGLMMGGAGVLYGLAPLGLSYVPGMTDEDLGLFRLGFGVQSGMLGAAGLAIDTINAFGC